MIRVMPVAFNTNACKPRASGDDPDRAVAVAATAL